MSVEVLPSARLRSAAENLAGFIRQARKELTAFGVDLPFDAPMWDITMSQVTRASAGHQVARLFFTTHEGGTKKGLEGRVPLAEPFASFVKALVRKKEEDGHVVANTHGVMLRAARYLYDALENVNYDPCRLLPMHFDEAAAACRAREMEASRYRVGVNLVAIADHVNRYGLAAVRLDWRNPFPRIVHGDTRIGAAADQRRSDKLPSEAALDAVANLSTKVTEYPDLLRIRVIELLACGGWRINELLTLPFDCEVSEAATNKGKPVLDAGGSPVERYGIRYFGEKGAGPRTKWIPTPMVDVAKRALADIMSITAPSREVAAWMEDNPGRAWLPSSWGDCAEFSARDIAGMLGLASSGNATVFMKSKTPVRKEGRRLFFKRADVEDVLLSRERPKLRTDVPFTFKHYLFLMPRNWSHLGKASLASLPEPVTDTDIRLFITGSESCPSVFKRHGFVEEDGRPIRITSHQFRHWLNTLAQQGGMSQMEIARWSGRKDVRQNSEYDHVSGFELAERARKMLAEGKVHGTIARIITRLEPVARADFIRSQVTTAHSTDLGMCANDWSLAPCMEHGACAGCEQHLLVKGDEAQRERAGQLLDEHKGLLEVAQLEADEETYGASNFVAHHARMRDALVRVLAVHDDASIPNGELVQLDLTSGIPLIHSAEARSLDAA